MPAIVVVVVVLAIALVVWLAVRAYKQEQARVASLAAFAASKGWRFSPGDPYGLPDRWQGDPFETGYDREASNVLTGEIRGRRVVAFDYRYKEDSTDSQGHTTTSTSHFAVFAVGMPCPLPALTIAPEGVFSRLGHALGMQDIELESEEFNRTFKVRCPDQKLAMDVLSPRTMQLLLRAGKLHLRFAGSDVVSWNDGLLEPVDIVERTEVLAGVVDGVPEFVWKDHS